MQHYETHLFARFQKVTTLDDFFKMKLECQKIYIENTGSRLLDPDYEIRVNNCQNAIFIEELVNYRIKVLVTGVEIGKPHGLDNSVTSIADANAVE